MAVALLGAASRITSPALCCLTRASGVALEAVRQGSKHSSPAVQLRVMEQLIEIRYTWFLFSTRAHGAHTPEV